MAALPLSAAERGAVALLAKKLLLALLVMGAEAVTGSLIPAQDITSDPQTTLRRVLREAVRSSRANSSRLGVPGSPLDEAPKVPSGDPVAPSGTAVCHPSRAKGAIDDAPSLWGVSRRPIDDARRPCSARLAPSPTARRPPPTRQYTAIPTDASGTYAAGRSRGAMREAPRRSCAVSRVVSGSSSWSPARAYHALKLCAGGPSATTT